MNIIDIAGIQLIVPRSDYDYYWTMKNIGENSDAFKTSCRRLLGLAPDCHHFDFSFIQFRIWGDYDKEHCIQKILKSGLIEYEEELYKNQPSPQHKGAAYTIKCEQAIKEVDDEFEEEFSTYV